MRDDPTIGCFVAVARDVTEQVDSQDALRHSEEHIRALVQHSADLIAVIDTDGMLLHPTPNDDPRLCRRLVGRAATPWTSCIPTTSMRRRAALARACARPGRTRRGSSCASVMPTAAGVDFECS